MYVVILIFSSTECIKLITEIPSITSTNAITTADIITNTTVTTATIVTSPSVSVATPEMVQLTSPQNSAGTYVCI